MYYIFKNLYCIGAYSYLPSLESDETAIYSDIEYKKLHLLRLKDGKIDLLPEPQEPPKVIENEDYAPETVELFEAVAGLYELIEHKKEK
jgi:hypothetical protein|nr:MAG TPA: hypothetical protein [Caudoviricetes sp.]